MVSPFDKSRKHPPRVVTVLGHKIKIRVIKNLIDDGDDLLGAFNSENMTIFLLKRPNWHHVLFHELLHASIYLSGAGEGMSINKEESIVLALEHAIFPLI